MQSCVNAGEKVACAVHGEGILIYSPSGKGRVKRYVNWRLLLAVWR